MPANIGCDAHKQFSVFATIDSKGKTSPAVRGRGSPAGVYRLPSHAAAGERDRSRSHRYWMVDEMEKTGHRPHLANPTKAKKQMGKTNKTDALDAKGLAILLTTGRCRRVGFRLENYETAANCSGLVWPCAISGLP